MSNAQLLLPWFSLFLFTQLFHVSGSDVGVGARYSPPYLPTACNGNDPSQFPSGNLFAVAGDKIWDDGAACGRRYLVRCIGGVTCIPDRIIQVTIFDRAARSASTPSREGAAMVLSTSAFEAIAVGFPASINIQFQQ